MSQRYSDNERSSIFMSVVECRRKRLSWPETHGIAKKAGFRGGVPALQVFIMKQRKKNKKTWRETGKKVQASLKAMRPENQLESAVEKLVSERVRVAIEKAIEALKRAV